EPGGWERLRWRSWDLGDLLGKEAMLQVIDRRKGGWGHINVDQIVQSDRPRQSGPARRELAISHRYLHLPVRTGAEMRRMKLSIDGQTVREFDIELDAEKPSFWVFSDLADDRGKTLQVEVAELEPGGRGLEALVLSDAVPDADAMYRERLRPQFHFTSRRGWHNDPNGLVWQDGRYHLFYQHNPFGWNWGNMHWGHAVSPDLVHWEELPTAIYPRKYGDWVFSGSAVVDAANTGGFRNGAKPPLVAAFTSTGRGECIVSSNDQGLTWQEIPENPVVRHPGRDPRLVWYAPGRHWVMAVYDEAGGKQGIAFHTSKDLRHWTFQSRIDGFYECPDLFELPVEGRKERSLWVLHAADGKYLLGDFDGRAFRPTGGNQKRQVWYGNFYAAQTFSNAPHGRRIQIGWGQGVTFPGMPFNQQMTVPVELSLRPAEDGVRMFARPVRELEALRGKRHEWKDLKVAAGENPLASVKGDLLEIELFHETAGGKPLELDLRGTSLIYDPARRVLSCKKVTAPLAPIDGMIGLHVFLDRGSIEVFGNDGRVAMSVAAIPDEGNHSIGIASREGPATVRSLVVHELRPAWPGP
ncbi:MAG: glycoside hydrolase family 32 protein, partial [Isosphaeraceae bacterium]